MEIDNKLLSTLQLIQKETNTGYLKDIIDLISSNQLYRDRIDEILNKHLIPGYIDAKSEFIDLIIKYLNFILEDDIIDDTEYYNVKQLKRLFKIRAGDFNRLKKTEMVEILSKQYHKMLADDQIDEFEEIHLAKLQGLFGLSYDQINKIAKDIT